MKIKVKKGVDGWRWSLVAGNHEIMASGEAYTRKSNALRAVERMQEEIANATVVIIPKEVPKAKVLPDDMSDVMGAEEQIN